MIRLPRLLQFLLAIIAINLVLLSLFRIGFWGYFDDPHNPIPFDELARALYIGLKFDLRLSLLILLPLFLLAWLKWLSPFELKQARWFWLGYLTLVFAAVLLFYITGVGYYAYLQKPLDATILRFADDFMISADMVWQTYPVFWLALLIIALSASYSYLMSRVITFYAPVAPLGPGKWKKTAVAMVTFFVVVFGIYGKFSYYPLRWSDAFSSTHSFTPAVTLNPVLYFFNTLKNKRITYSEETTRQYYEVMARYLSVTQPDKHSLNYQRIIARPGPLANKKPNIVMVFLESFASYKTTTFGNPLDPTPHFDELAQNGLLFKRFYTPSTGTARSVFTALTGIPDIELNKTSSRNPLVVDQYTLVNAFASYEKFYFLGGSANWGNIRGILSHNIPGLHIYEEGGYSAERVDVWGISDLHLFEEANTILKQQDKPFFAIIQTAGNHRPYTIPEDNRGFKFDNRSNVELKQHGFISNDEYNSFRYMDHSVGFFMDIARQAGYFDNTLFVFFGDHGISGFGGDHTPAFETHFDLTSLHVPFVIYAPKLIPEPKTYDKIASEVDVLPTLAGLAAPAHITTTLGRDLLDSRYDDQRYAFTITHHKVPEISLLGRDFLLRMSADGSNKALYATEAGQYKQNVIEQYPDIAATMERLNLGIHETAKYMRHNNKGEE